MTGSGIDARAFRLTSLGAAIASAILAGAALGWLPAAAQAQQSNAPTSLLPAPEKPRTPGAEKPAQPAADLPQATPPGDNPIEVQKLQNVDLNAFGTMDEGHGGFPASLWTNADAALVAKLLPAVGPSSSRTFQTLIRRLLLSAVTPPAGGGDKLRDNAFLVARIRTLWAVGDTGDLATFLNALPLPAITPPLRRLRADAALLAGDGATACAEAGPLATSNATDPYPVELRVYCQLADGKGGAASLGIDVLREQNVNDPDFFALADPLTSGAPPPKGAVAASSPLVLALARLAKAEQAAPGPSASPAVLRAIALASGTPLETRLVAGERAESLGALDTETLRRLAESVPFTADDLANAETKAAKDGPARGRAMLVQAAERQAAPLAKAGLIARSLSGLDGTPTYFTQARSLAPQIASLQPSAEINLFVPALARALLAAHQTDAARNWIGWARAQATADKSMTDAAAGLAVVARIAKLDDSPLTAETIDAWRKAAGALPADRAERRAALGLALLAALGEAVPAEATLAQIDGTALVAAQTPRPALALGLDTASAGKQLGETILFAYLVAADGSLTQLDVASIARLVAALKAAGLDEDARALALEAALANGV